MKGSCKDTLPLRKNRPPVFLADHKRGQKGQRSEKLYFESGKSYEELDGN